MECSWTELWREAVYDLKGLPSVDENVRRIVRVARDVGGEGFEDIQEEEVEELLQSHQEELTEEDLEEIICLSEESGDEEKVMVPESLKTKMLAEV